IAGILAMQPQAISQGTPANGSAQGSQGAGQTGQQPSPAAGSTLSVVCVIDDPSASGEQHTCANNSYTANLGHHLKLRVNGLQKWLEEKNAPESLALFINGKEIKDSHPISVNPEQSELGFKLDKTTGSETT